MDMASKVGGAVLLAETEWTPKSGISKERAMGLAALEAMREPDHDMTGAVLRPGEDRTFLVSLWQGMVDAALGQRPKQPLPLPDRR